MSRDTDQLEMARKRGEALAAKIHEQGARYRYYLVKLTLNGDMYYQTVVNEPHLASQEMTNLRELAHSKGFQVDMHRLDTIEEMERFLLQLPS